MRSADGLGQAPRRTIVCALASADARVQHARGTRRAALEQVHRDIETDAKKREIADTSAEPAGAADLALRLRIGY